MINAEMCKNVRDVVNKMNALSITKEKLIKIIETVDKQYAIIYEE